MLPHGHGRRVQGELLVDFGMALPDVYFLNRADQEERNTDRLIANIVEHRRATNQFRIESPGVGIFGIERPGPADRLSDRGSDSQARRLSNLVRVDEVSGIEERLVEKAGLEHLKNLAGLLSSRNNGIGFFNRGGNRALYRDVLASAKGRDGLPSVQMIWRDDLDGIDVGVLKHLLETGVIVSSTPIQRTPDG